MTATAEKETVPVWQTAMELREEIIITRMMVERAGNLFFEMAESKTVEPQEADAMFILELRLREVERRLLSLMK